MRLPAAIPTHWVIVVFASFVMGLLIGLLIDPRYSMTNAGGGRVVRLDKWTGEIKLFHPENMDVGDDWVTIPDNAWDEFQTVNNINAN